MTQVAIRQLWVYPIKSLGGISLDSAAITAFGSFALDREWVIVSPEHKMLWQGDLPRMALTRLAMTDQTLTLSMPGMPPFDLARDHDGEPAAFTMYKHDFSGVDAGDAIAAWLTQAFCSPCRLVRIAQGAHTWSGLNPVHVVSDASLAALNEALAAKGDAPVELERFRPNIVLGGDATPFFEEAYDTLQFGAATLTLREPCVRCELPNIDRHDATRHKQPLKLIGAMSKTRDTSKPASFGTYATVSGTDILRVGMTADIG